MTYFEIALNLDSKFRVETSTIILTSTPQVQNITSGSRESSNVINTLKTK